MADWFFCRGKVFLATKFGVRGLQDGTRIFSNQPEYIRTAIDGSLERLRTEWVDLWYWSVHVSARVLRPDAHFSASHRLDGKVPVETVVGTMAEAVTAGKVKYLGLSECSSETLRRACKVQ